VSHRPLEEGKRASSSVEHGGESSRVFGLIGEFTGGETPVGRSALAVGGGSKGGGRERAGWVDSVWAEAVALGQLGPGGEKEREGRQLGQAKAIAGPPALLDWAEREKVKEVFSFSIF
jgi:hypothetical protein